LFNNVVPRPINSYVGNALQVFRCPHDEGGFDWAAGNSHFEWVGNSYSFNSVGYPLTAMAPYTDKGLAGRRTVELKHPDRTVIFMDTSLHKAPGSWHGKYGNVSFVDAHVEFIGLPPEDPTTSGIYWDP
ncbi:MAG: hypothetical protein NTW19_04115, partial [Planctomycetota bacterium]|nr:hypothetical protein [Planctomycetota bacterium]